MTPLQKIAMGLVLITFRAPFLATTVEGPLGPVPVGWDGLAAPVGWGLVLAGVVGLPTALPRRQALVALTAAAGLVSVPLWFPQLQTVVLGIAELAWAASVPQWAALTLLCWVILTAPEDAPQQVAAMPAGRRWPVFGLRTAAVAFAFLAVAPPLIIAGGLEALAAPAGAVQLIAPLYLIWTLFRLHRRLPAATETPTPTAATD